MKLLLILTLFLPISAFATCPDLTGQFYCQASHVAISFQKEKDASYRIIEKDDLSKPYEYRLIAPSYYEYVLKTGRGSNRVSCSEDGLILLSNDFDFLSDRETHKMTLYSLDDNQDLVISKAELKDSYGWIGGYDSVTCYKPRKTANAIEPL